MLGVLSVSWECFSAVFGLRRKYEIFACAARLRRAGSKTPFAPVSKTCRGGGGRFEQRFGACLSVCLCEALYTDDRTLYTDDRLHAQQLRFFNLEKEAPPAGGRWPCPDPIDDVINDVILT